MGIEAAIIGSAVAGGAASMYGANKMSGAQDRANQANAEAFRFSKPYIKRSYDAAEGYLADSQAMGAYTGDTYAGPNAYQMVGNQYIGNMGALGAQGAFDLSQIGQNFGQNYADMYEAGGADRMGQAQQYALDNSQPLIDAAMRDDYRNLTEKTLPGINMASSGGGNINSSRAGMADAIANRGFSDRKADVSAGINQSLMDQSLNQQNRQFKDMMNANEGINRSYLQGINAMGSMGDFMTGAGRNLQGYDQAYLNDQRARFENQRDFGLDQQIKYQQGILGQAVYNNPQQQPNYHSPGAAAFGGAMQGAGMGMDFAKFMKNYGDSSGGTTPAPSGGWHNAFGGS